MSLEKTNSIVYNEEDLPVKKQKIHNQRILKMTELSNITNSLAHTKRNCKYHIVFEPKYRRKIFYEEHRLEIREILKNSVNGKVWKKIEGEVCPDHIYILVLIPPKMSISVFMGHLKGKSATIIFQRWGNMKFAYRNREFWCKGY